MVFISLTSPFTLFPTFFVCACRGGVPRMDHYIPGLLNKQWFGITYQLLDLHTKYRLWCRTAHTYMHTCTHIYSCVNYTSVNAYQ